MHILRFRSITIIVQSFSRSGYSALKNVRAHEGWGIVVDRQGQIYFSDIPTNTIWRITRDGILERVLNKHSHTIVLGEDGSIYGTQEHYAAAVGSVWRIAPDGGYIAYVVHPPFDI